MSISISSGSHNPFPNPFVGVSLAIFIGQWEETLILYGPFTLAETESNGLFTLRETDSGIDSDSDPVPIVGS